MTLNEAQDYIERMAPGPYYRDHYRGYEADYLAHVVAEIEQYNSGQQVLEVGPGWGTLSVWMANRGHQVTVLDDQPLGTYIAPVLLAQTGIRYVQGAIDRDELPAQLGNHYQLVVMTQVIPHLKWSPADAVGNVASVMHPEGILVTSALDAECYPHIHPAFAHWRDVPEWAPGAEPAPELEVCMYTHETLAELLSGSFTSVRVWRPEGSTTMLATCRGVS
jgi:2-polyprenyl-3-methyl-5-hydroxy-6-metoxy-1,4-benzoquinol methylase